MRDGTHFGARSRNGQLFGKAVTLLDPILDRGAAARLAAARYASLRACAGLAAEPS